MAEKEYIERETLKILFAGACAECRDSCAEFDGIEADCNQCLLNSVIKDAKSTPAADVRPVVLCRDCIFRSNEWTGCPKLNGTITGDEFFCKCGIKREES